MNMKQNKNSKFVSIYSSLAIGITGSFLISFALPYFTVCLTLSFSTCKGFIFYRQLVCDKNIISQQ